MAIPPTYKGLRWNADSQVLEVVFEGTVLFHIEQVVSSNPAAGNSQVTNIYSEGTDLIVVSDE